MAIAGLLNRSGGIPVKTKALDPGVGGQYDGPTNEMTLPRDDYGRTLGERMVIVHEATHAVFDLRKIKDLWWQHNELASYIAGGLYGVHCGLSGSMTGVWGHAVEVAKKLKSTPGAEPDWSIVATMSETIMKSATYKGAAETILFDYPS